MFNVEPEARLLYLEMPENWELCMVFDYFQFSTQHSNRVRQSFPILNVHHEIVRT